MSYVPLAEKLRPTKLSDVIGQKHLIGQGKILTEIINSGKPRSLIFWGPAGSGKTTIARVLSTELDAVFKELSAVNAGKADVMRVIEDAKINNRLGMKTILFIDEIHRFSKSQQDAFLPFVEDGTIILIGATTENPSFEVIGPLISRSRILLLEPLNDDEMQQLIKNAIKHEKIPTKNLPTESIKTLVRIAEGDARVALGNLELAMELSKGVITPDSIKLAAQTKMPKYDKNAEQHYNVISAFIKSMRGSDPNATLYYLARMLKSGEDPKFIARRMVVFASEDIGLKASAALNLAVSTFLAVERIGMPECEHNLYHCALVLAKAEKSRLIVEAMGRAKEVAEQHPSAPVPFHLQSKATRITKSKSDKAGGKHNKSDYDQGFMPEGMENIKII